MLKICTVIGARPQFIKAAAVSRITQVEGDVNEILIHTGQHYDADMSQVFFDELGIPAPHHYLGVGSGSHGMQTGRMLEALERVFLEECPDWVLVYGDTNSTLAGALAAAKLHIPIAHVEAGLRSFNRRMPEEVNRVMTDHLSDLLFVPTNEAKRNLLREARPLEAIQETGDVMYDVALYSGLKARETSTILNKIGIRSGGYYLCTIHRAENTDDIDRLRSLFEGLCRLATHYPVVLPLHPRTRKALEGCDLLDKVSRLLRVTRPLGYLDLVNLEQHARAIATDSGGVQKEAFFHRVPCFTLRGETEWVELVSGGWNQLIPSVDENLAERLLDLSGFQREDIAPYGDGDAARKIVEALRASTFENFATTSHR